MSLYTRLCSQWLFPLQERLKGHHSVALLRALEQSQWYAPEALAALQLQRLRSFLVDIGQRVPYYQKLFADLGFEPAGLCSLADLQALPLLDKPGIRRNRAQMLAQGHGPLMRYSTGGASGEPLVFPIGLGRKSHDVAAKWRATRWWGVDIGDPELVVWGSPIELRAQDRLKRLRDAALRSHLLPAFGVTSQKLDQFVRTIERRRPAMLFGYPSSLAQIADRACLLGADLRGVGIRVVFVTGELLFEAQRQRISQVFGCPVANGYGSRDAGFIAHECPCGSLHLSAEDLVVEILRPNGQPAAPGELGELVVTHMATAEFAFVRYRTGDMAALSPLRCACGRGLPVLAQVQGKSNHFVVAQDGSVLPASALTYVLRDLPQLVQYQIHQTSLSHTVVRLVCSELDSVSRQRIVHGFQARLGAGVHIEVLQLGEIAPAPSGKHRFVVSELDAFAQVGSTVAHA
jgi:phenylacetate-CoA ligase